MTTQDIGLFKAIGAKMEYLSQRQRIISQNVANADTPDYRPQDLNPVDFGTVLKNVTQSKGVTMAATQPMHIGYDGGQIDPAKSDKQKQVYETAPDGNSVIMEEQMVKANQTMMDFNLMTSLYQKNMRMIQIALGTSE